MSEYVRLEVEDGIGTIRIDRPKAMNALDTDIQEAIRGYSHEATVRKDIEAVIVYGGEKVFAAGVDIKGMVSMSYTDMVDRATLLTGCFTAVAQIPKPTLAAVTGFALGGGCELALCCDFRIAGEGTKFGQPEILLGTIPGAGATQRLPRLIGASRAKDIIYTGRFVGAEEALRIGLVDDVVPAADVYSTARERMSRFVGGPAYALRAAKEAIDRGIEVDLATGLAIETAVFTGTFATRDRNIGMDSFVEHGPGKASFEGA